MRKKNFAWARHSKSLSAGSCEVTCMDLAIDLIYELVMYSKSLSVGSLRLHAGFGHQLEALVARFDTMTSWYDNLSPASLVRFCA